ncbi:MAG: 3,4-dihydroxy-2-butanone-4-phosphate synthase [Candidatus Micrarchaeaceae archaeon]
MSIDKALEALRNGRPIFVFDSESREGETDMVFASQFITPEAVKLMRKGGGGLICITMPHEAASVLGLDYLLNIYMRSRMRFIKYLYPSDIPYGEKSAFSITINHRKTFTGITDNDRALTISEFALVVKHALAAKTQQSRAKVLAEFGKKFRSPGHVFTLVAAKGLFSMRKGHTELTTYLVSRAGLIPSAAIVEMLADNGLSLDKKSAKEYARAHGYVFLEGREIIEAAMHDSAIRQLTPSC